MRKIKRNKTRSKTILDPSWNDLEPFWGTILGEQAAEGLYCPGEPQTTQNRPKKFQNDTKTRPKTHQNDSKRHPRGQKSDPKSQDQKRTEPRRSQGRLGSPRGGVPPVYPHPRGAIWEAKSAPKSIPKQLKTEANI